MIFYFYALVIRVGIWWPLAVWKDFEFGQEILIRRPVQDCSGATPGGETKGAGSLPPWAPRRAHDLAPWPRPNDLLPGRGPANTLLPWNLAPQPVPMLRQVYSICTLTHGHEQMHY